MRAKTAMAVKQAHPVERTLPLQRTRAFPLPPLTLVALRIRLRPRLQRAEHSPHTGKMPEFPPTVCSAPGQVATAAQALSRHAFEHNSPYLWLAPSHRQWTLSQRQGPRPRLLQAPQPPRLLVRQHPPSRQPSLRGPRCRPVLTVRPSRVHLLRSFSPLPCPCGAVEFFNCRGRFTTDFQVVVICNFIGTGGVCLTWVRSRNPHCGAIHIAHCIAQSLRDAYFVVATQLPSSSRTSKELARIRHGGAIHVAGDHGAPCRRCSARCIPRDDDHLRLQQGIFGQSGGPGQALTRAGFWGNAAAADQSLMIARGQTHTHRS